MEDVHTMKQTARRDKSNTVSCKFCGNTHERDKNKCAAFRKSGKKCGEENHFGVKCITKQDKCKGK